MTRIQQIALAIGLLTAVPVCMAQSVVIPQVVDGGGWRTTIVIVNTTAGTTSASLNFYMDTSGGVTQPWNLAFVEGATTNVTLPAAGTIFLHTAGTATANTSGWAQVQASAGVAVHAVFTFTAGSSEQSETSVAGAGSSRILIPFDNTGDLTTAFAIANPTGASETVTGAIQFADGSTAQASLPTLPAQGHLAFLFPSQFPQTTGRAGLAEFYVTGGSIAALGILANSALGFTSLPVYPATGTPIIVVRAPTLQVQSVTLAASSASGAQTIQGTVLLSAAAPAGGATITLSSSSQAATVPASVTVPAGTTSATFSVTTTAVSSAQAATITASYQGTSAKATLSLAPPSSSSAPFLNLTCSVTLQPAGYSPGAGTVVVYPDPGGPTFSALALVVGNATQLSLAFSGGAASNNGNTLTFSTLSAPGVFYSGSTSLSASAASLTLGLTQTSTTSAYANYTVAGSFTVTGTPSGSSGGTGSTTVTGSVSGACYAALQ